MPGPPSSPPCPIITLITDFGLTDWYVATLKGVLIAACREVRLVDVTHRVPPGDVLCASISLERAIDGFPEGTIHLAVVDPGVGSARRMLIAKINEQWVVCPDNGLVTWAWRRHPGGKAYAITWRPQRSSATFHGRDIMGPVAAMLATGEGSPDTLGRPIDDPILLDVQPAMPGATVGHIIHIDHFGNATTDVSASAVEPSPRAEIHLGPRNLGSLKRTYMDVAPGQALPLVGSSGLLEIAVRDGSAAALLGLRVGDEVHLRNPDHSTQALRKLDKEHIWHPFTPMSLWLESDPLVICAAQGMHLIDSDGKRYLDGVSSLWCNVHGHHVPEIDEAVREQLERVAHTTLLGLASEPSILLAERLMKIVPPNLKKVFYSDAGATATEIAFKMAVQYWFNIGRPEKNEFIGFAEAYHGDTFGAMSIGRTMAFHRPYLPMLFKVHFAPTPFVYHPPAGIEPNPEAVRKHCLSELERLLKENAPRIAAIAIEPIVQGAAGMIVQPEGFLKEVRRLASQYEVLLICDEVATGFGRTGRMFACEHEAVEPDLMCAAKGITGGYLPLAATFATQKIFDAFLGQPAEGKTFFHGHTYTGNALACAAAMASLDLFEKHHLIERVQAKSAALAKMLEPLKTLPHVGDIRQKGMMIGIELVADKPTRTSFDRSLRTGAAICERIRRRGIILRPLADTIILMPPLAMELDDLRTIVDAVAAEIGELRPGGNK
jgi:adenosylmethionine-8-amino-7-oxononanoate aminotransferase